jgi:HSP20 family protein
MPDKKTEVRSEQQGSNRELSRSSQQQQPMRRGGYDPFTTSPSEFFANPFAAMRRMHDEMDRMMAGAFSRDPGAGAMGGMGFWSPALEISEKDNEVCVCAELPGLKPEDVKVEMTDDALVIEGERKEERNDEQGGRRTSERRYGRFYRTIPLPEGANTEQVRADFTNGELRVTIPVERPQSKRRQIPISSSSAAPESQKR